MASNGNPLPPYPERWPASGKIGDAYEKCITYEQTATFQKEARLLGYLLLHVDQEARSRLVEEIESCGPAPEGSVPFVELAKFYIDNIFCLVKGTTTRTPSPDSHPSRPSFSALCEEALEKLIGVPRSYSTAKHLALKRDGYRCMLSSKYETNADLKFEFPDASVAGVTKTECAHILSRTINQNIQQGQKREFAATTWAVLTRMGPGGPNEYIYEELNGLDVYRLENVLTLDSTVHYHFDRLNIWLEAIDGKEHTYKVCYAFPRLKTSLKIPDTVTFTSTHKELALPSPHYLRLHALCAKVAHLSGAAEYICRIMDDVDKGVTKTLAMDGSDAEILRLLIATRGITVPLWSE